MDIKSIAIAMLTLDKAVSDLFIAAKIHIIHDNAKYYWRKITIE